MKLLGASGIEFMLIFAEYDVRHHKVQLVVASNDQDIEGNLFFKSRGVTNFVYNVDSQDNQLNCRELRFPPAVVFPDYPVL